ncbi:MAG: prepilin-type N-terminal cleavage/methylation domain-containing protein [Minisyncoccia bacterium]
MERIFSYRFLKAAHPVAGSSRGYTLIEMLIVLAIIIIIAAIAIGGQSNFNRTLSLNNAAFDIALSIRQAQSFGLSSRSASGVSNAGYGLHFNRTEESSYIFFADTKPSASSDATPDTKPGNGIYYTGGTATSMDTLVATYTLNNGFTISGFCAYDASANVWDCTSDTDPLRFLDIVFTRPNSDVRVHGRTNSGTGYLSYVKACITVAGPTGETRSVSVSDTGQVSTVSTCP